MNEEYNLDNYLKQYIAQHPTLTTYIKWKTIPTLPPPRTPPINIPIPKVSNTVNEERYNFTSVLQSLVDNTHEDSAINSKASLDPSIDCIPSEYAIDNQLKSTNNSHLISIPTITASYPETSCHEYSQFPTVEITDKLPDSKISITKPLLSPSDKVSSTLLSKISISLDVLQKTVGV